MNPFYLFILMMLLFDFIYEPLTDYTTLYVAPVDR